MIGLVGKPGRALRGIDSLKLSAMGSFSHLRVVLNDSVTIRRSHFNERFHIRVCIGRLLSCCMDSAGTLQRPEAVVWVTWVQLLSHILARFPSLPT